MEEKILELIGVVDELNGCIENILNTILPPDCDLIVRDETGHEYHLRSYSIDRAWKLLRDNYINFSAHFNDISNVTDVALLYGNIKEYLKLGVKPWNDDNQVYSSCEKWWKVFEYNNFQTLELSMEQQAKGEPQQSKLDYYCQKAVGLGYLKKTTAGYQKVTWTKAQLVYFLSHFLNSDNTFPDKEYSVMFGESRLSKSLSQLMDNKNGDGKPKGYEKIDELLQE